MKASNIAIGDRLLFTMTARNAYGIIEQGIIVDNLTYRKGYKTPVIWDNLGRAFQPKDFAYKVSRIPGEPL